MDGFSPAFREGRKYFAYGITKKSMVDIINAMVEFGIQLEDSQLQVID
jgi:hypothetical protein